MDFKHPEHEQRTAFDACKMEVNDKEDFISSGRQSGTEFHGSTVHEGVNGTRKEDFYFQSDTERQTVWWGTT